VCRLSVSLKGNLRTQCDQPRATSLRRPADCWPGARANAGSAGRGAGARHLGLTLFKGYDVRERRTSDRLVINARWGLTRFPGVYHGQRDMADTDGGPFPVPSRRYEIDLGQGSGSPFMTLSRDARLVAGITLLAVPTIMYGGLTLLGILTMGNAGMAPEALRLDDRQWALFRAGHAHAGVWVLLSLVLQVLLDAATASHALKWSARIAAPFGAIAISGGFFGLAYHPACGQLVYLGAASMAAAVIVTGIGLIRRERTQR
jgi:hypothetical protein